MGCGGRSCGCWRSASAGVGAGHDAAGVLSLQIHVLQVSNESQIDQAFATFANLRPDALVVSASGFLGARRIQIIELAARNSLPAMGFGHEFPVAGGLISYGASIPEVFRQGGVYTGRILKGQKPSEMPVLQPTKFELAINLNSAGTRPRRAADPARHSRRSDRVETQFAAAR